MSRGEGAARPLWLVTQAHGVTRNTLWKADKIPGGDGQLSWGWVATLLAQLCCWPQEQESCPRELSPRGCSCVRRPLRGSQSWVIPTHPSLSTGSLVWLHLLLNVCPLLGGPKQHPKVRALSNFCIPPMCHRMLCLLAARGGVLYPWGRYSFLCGYSIWTSRHLTFLSGVPQNMS